MKCLHGEPCAHSTTQKGSFWYCNQNPSCNFFCSEDEGYLYEKALTAWKCTEQPQPRYEKHNKLAKMRIVKDPMKASYGRAFFLWTDKSKPCSHWVWGEVKPIAKPECRHGFPCVGGPTMKLLWKIWIFNFFQNSKNHIFWTLLHHPYSFYCNKLALNPGNKTNSWAYGVYLP